MDDNEQPDSIRVGSEAADSNPSGAESAVATEQEVAVAPVAISTPGADAVAWTYLKMLKEIRSWGYWSLGLGAMHLISFGIFSAPWGVLLVVVGLASFYYREAGMFVIYGATLAWAAVSNALGKEPTWMIIAAFQALMAVQVFRQFRRFHRAQADVIALPDAGTRAAILAPARAERAFPVIGCLFSALGVGGVVATFIGILVASAGRGVPEYFNFIIGLVVIVAVLGLSVSLASVLSRYRYRVLGILGIIASALVLILWIWLSVA